MGELRWPDPVLLVVAVISRHPSAIEWALRELEQTYGPVALTSPSFEFTETQFYEPTMGQGLLKQFLAFERLIDPAVLADIKRQTNDLEVQYQQQFPAIEARPVNLDPGYISPAKLVLATTKDRDHRLYLRDGIFAEVTLHFQRGKWTSQRWTYPDYQRADFHAFFDRCRDYLRQKPPATADL